MRILYAILATLFLLGACVNVTAPTKTATDDKVTATDNTPGEPKDSDPIPKQCTEAINYQVLIDALPKEVNGFVGDEPEGQMLSFTNPTDQTVMKYSTGKVTLTKDDKNIDVTATDTCYIQFLSMAWVGFYEMEGTDGYLKKTTISGNTGWHQYDKPGEAYSYNLFVKDRVIVSVQGSNGVADSDVTAAANAVNYGAISAAAK